MEKCRMRSSLTWLALLCSVAAGSWSCSSNDSSGPSQSGTEQLQGGTGGTGAAAPAPSSTAASTSAGGTGAAVASPTQPATRTPENAVPVGIDEGQKGQSGGVQSADAGAKEDAGRSETAEPDAGASAPPAAVVDAGVAAVTFANVFPILVTNCGSCHGANARNGLPQFAQQGNQAASFAATQGMSMNDLVSNRIIQRAVFQRSMPPACRAAALGSPNCLTQANADELQAWVNQGAKQ
jgi:hypothetical protein